MTNKYAKELAETITNEALAIMLKNAATGVSDWTKPSKANAGISRGSNWNMFCKDFDINKEHSPILKYRMLQEFGDFLAETYKQPRKVKPQVKTIHFKPDLKNWL